MTRSTVVTLLAALVLPGCAAPAPSAGGSEGFGGPPPATKSAAPAASRSATPAVSKTTRSKHTPEPSAHSAPAGPRIVSFRIAQRPKCAEGTAVFRADPVPLIIEWKLSGATRGALSVDDPTHTPGTYGSVDLEGSEEFEFSCAGEVGTTETHTYAIYTVGGGPTRSATLTASAKILDRGGAN